MQRKGSAVWKGGLKDGNGQVSTGSGGLNAAPYTFASRFESGGKTDPEELIAAAHAACFSMALSGQLSKAGFSPKRIATSAKVQLLKQEAGFAITLIELENESEVPGIDDAKFQELAGNAKTGCPVSKALAAVEIKLTAKLAG